MMGPIRVLSFLTALVVLSLILPTQANAAAACTRVTKGFVATASTTFCKGTYKLADSQGTGAIVVGASGITLDGMGVVLQGSLSRGYGIYLNGFSGVTIKGFKISGYYYGMRLENASNLTVTGNSSSANKRETSGNLTLSQPLGSAYGGGILLNRVTSSTIQGNTLQQQNVGLDLYESVGNTVSSNTASNNTGWGIHLLASTDNKLVGNQAHHNVRCASNWCGWDSAGIVLTAGSHHNQVLNNNLTYSGDGFFIGNGFDLASDDNLIDGNDGSYSPNNAFEATFSTGNTFRNNKASNSHYGFWLGYSSTTTVEGNTVQSNSADGINVDRGQGMTISDNTLTGNGGDAVGLTLLPASLPNPPTSTGHTLSGNTMATSASSGVYLQDTTDTTLAGNKLSGNRWGLYLQGASDGSQIHQSNLICSYGGKVCEYLVFNGMAGGKVDATSNWWGTTDSAAIDKLIFDRADDPTRGTVDYDPWLTAPIP